MKVDVCSLPAVTAGGFKVFHSSGSPLTPEEGSCGGAVQLPPVEENLFWLQPLLLELCVLCCQSETNAFYRSVSVKSLFIFFLSVYKKTIIELLF